MSELINNQSKRLSDLKELLKKINEPGDVSAIQKEIEEKLKTVPYEDVLIVEQELIAEGIPTEKMLELCDLHSNALRGLVNENVKQLHPAHPVSVFRLENKAINREVELIKFLFNQINELPNESEVGKLIIKLHGSFNNLMDIEKHYLRKENLLFPFLEKYNITGPSTVMWGKDDQIRRYLKNSVDALSKSHDIKAGEAKKYISEILQPAVNAVEDMIQKEEEILFPLSIDSLSEIDWYEIYQQTPEIGYCLVDIKEKWKPEGIAEKTKTRTDKGKIQLPSGSFTLEEVTAIFSTLPFDLTFVDKDDNVKFFTEGTERIFQRSRAILGRKVQYCHPPHSVNIVEKILSDFKEGKQNKAAFWINLHGTFVYICYYALRGENNEYLGTLEVTQNLTELRQLEGERRILQYDEPEMTIIKEDEKTMETLKPKIIYDAREDLANGFHPAEKVLSELATLSPGERYLLITPFPPMPLIMKAKEKGFTSEEERISQAEYHTYFFKN